jgi:hypothetical protein
LVRCDVCSFHHAHVAFRSRLYCWPCWRLLVLEAAGDAQGDAMRQASLNRCLDVEALHAVGVPIVAACERAGISAPTYYRYLREGQGEAERRCARCGLLIFKDAGQAWAKGIPWDERINRAVGRHCIGCAVHDV